MAVQGAAVLVPVSVGSYQAGQGIRANDEGLVFEGVLTGLSGGAMIGDGLGAGPRATGGGTQLQLPFAPPKPLTRGVLTLESGAQIPLASGLKGPAAVMPKGSPGFDAFTRTHVEGHAAALMRTEGASSATLYINNPRICPNCSRLLPDMLPPGSQLTVVLPNGTRTPFLGNAR
jgi:hypothetical protein